MAVLTCYRTRRHIGAYLDGALDDRAQRSAAAHVSTCPRCQHDAEKLRRLRAALQRHLPPPPPPDWTGFWAGVVREIEDDRHVTPAPAPRRWARLLWRPRIAFGGALAAAALISLTLWQAYAPPMLPAGAVVVWSARTEAPGGTVMVYSPPEQDIAVVWVFGLD